jgi:hypothetical protein
MGSLQSLRAGFTGANAYGLFKTGDENLAVTDFSGYRRFLYGLNDLLNQILPYCGLQLEFGQEINLVFRAPVKFRVAFLPAKTFYLAYGNSSDSNFMQGLPNVIQLEWLDDCCDQFHGILLIFRVRLNVFLNAGFMPCGKYSYIIVFFIYIYLLLAPGAQIRCESPAFAHC